MTQKNIHIIGLTLFIMTHEHFAKCFPYTIFDNNFFPKFSVTTPHTSQISIICKKTLFLKIIEVNLVELSPTQKSHHIHIDQ